MGRLSGVIDMKVVYFNDTERDQLVYENSLVGPYSTVAPASSIEVDLGDVGKVFIKVWETGTVLIGETK